MIKFFRKIRQNLLSEGKTGKYLKYAIGEIILVMIGILLALQVNSLYNNHQLKKEELKILHSIQNEFNENIVEYDKIYKKHLNRKRNIETIIESKLSEFSPDSLMTLNQGVNDNTTFDPFQGIYNSTISSGKIELISNNKLKIKIARFQDLLNDYKEEETGTMEFVKANLYPFQWNGLKLNFNISFNKKGVTEREKLELKQSLLPLMNSDKYHNLLLYTYGHMQF